MAQTKPSGQIRVGAAQVDMTPTGSMFLVGYPHVQRLSTGVHDPLLASALCIVEEGGATAIFVACDIICVSKETSHRARKRIEQAIGIAPSQIMIAATHTHSGPVTRSMISNEADPVVPPPDPKYLTNMEDAIVRAATEAFRAARPATLHESTADGTGLGTNRRDPVGPAIPRIPVVVARDAQSNALIAVMLVTSMHPTVLHEDSTLISGDFPGLARRWFQKEVASCPFVYFMGASGNQSPRHVVKANTLAEAHRLGELLGRRVKEAVDRVTPIASVALRCASTTTDLPLRRFPNIAEAQRNLQRVAGRLKQLRDEGAARTQVRTAECDWFGAEETLVLAKAAADGRTAAAARQCLPAEVQVIAVGPWYFVAWQGETFVEFALEVMAKHPQASIITLAHGELQGYLVTQEAVDEGGYEASNALLASPQSGKQLVAVSLKLLDRLNAGAR